MNSEADDERRRLQNEVERLRKVGYTFNALYIVHELCFIFIQCYSK